MSKEEKRGWLPFRRGPTVRELLAEILEVLREILKAVSLSVVPAVLEVVVTLPNGTTVKGNHVSATFTDIQSLPLTLAETDAKGNPVTPVGPASFNSSNSGVASVTPNPDNVSAVVTPGTALGTATITVSCDGLSASLDVTVVASAPTTLTIVPGTPTP